MDKYLDEIKEAVTKANIYIILSNAAGDMFISPKQWNQLLKVANVRLEYIKCLG